MSIDDQVATLFEHDKAAKKFVDHDYIWNQREYRYQGRLQ